MRALQAFLLALAALHGAAALAQPCANPRTRAVVRWPDAPGKAASEIVLEVTNAPRAQYSLRDHVGRDVPIDVARLDEVAREVGTIPEPTYGLIRYVHLRPLVAPTVTASVTVIVRSDGRGTEPILEQIVLLGAASPVTAPAAPSSGVRLYLARTNLARGETFGACDLTANELSQLEVPVAGMWRARTPFLVRVRPLFSAEPAGSCWREPESEILVTYDRTLPLEFSFYGHDRGCMGAEISVRALGSTTWARTRISAPTRCGTMSTLVAAPSLSRWSASPVTCACAAGGDGGVTSMCGAAAPDAGPPDAGVHDAGPQVGLPGDFGGGRAERAPRSKDDYPWATDDTPPAEEVVEEYAGDPAPDDPTAPGPTVPGSVTPGPGADPVAPSCASTVPGDAALSTLLALSMLARARRRRR